MEGWAFGVGTGALGTIPGVIYNYCDFGTRRNEISQDHFSTGTSFGRGVCSLVKFKVPFHSSLGYHNQKGSRFKLEQR